MRISTEELEKIMEEDGWTIICQSPYELEHTNGCTATGYGATLVRDSYIEPDITIEYHEKSLVEFLNSLRDYMHESRNTLLNDERTSEEFVKIFLEKQNKDE